MSPDLTVAGSTGTLTGHDGTVTLPALAMTAATLGSSDSAVTTMLNSGPARLMTSTAVAPVIGCQAAVGLWIATTFSGAWKFLATPPNSTGGWSTTHAGARKIHFTDTNVGAADRPVNP